MTLGRGGLAQTWRDKWNKIVNLEIRKLFLHPRVVFGQFYLGRPEYIVEYFQTSLFFACH